MLYQTVYILVVYALIHANTIIEILKMFTDMYGSQNVFGLLLVMR